MGIHQELWRDTILPEARGSGASAGREPAALHKQQKADTLKEHSSGVGGGGGSSWVSFHRAKRWTWGSSAPLLVWAAWKGPGCLVPLLTLGTF